jgi:hypothetical protein
MTWISSVSSGTAKAFQKGRLPISSRENPVAFRPARFMPMTVPSASRVSTSVSTRSRSVEAKPLAWCNSPSARISASDEVSRWAIVSASRTSSGRKGRFRSV